MQSIEQITNKLFTENQTTLPQQALVSMCVDDFYKSSVAREFMRQKIRTKHFHIWKDVSRIYKVALGPKNPCET